MPRIIYLDMDGVLADFDSYTTPVIGKPLKEFKPSQAGWDALEAAGIKDALYSKLEPMPDAKDLVEGVIYVAKAHNCGVAILTAIPKLGRVLLAEQQKKEWLKRYFPELLNNFKIGPYAVDKQLHCCKGDILIDDSDMNIPQWNAAGGYGILHTSAVDTLGDLMIWLNRNREVA